MLRYFGPPGTGKTTTLLNQVERFLSEGVSPNDIGYFAFTRKASNVARDRAVARFKLDPDEDFTYFRTLHSLAFLLMGYNSSEILKESHLREFSEKVGVDLTTGSGKIEDEGFVMFRSNHPVMRCMDLARSTLQGPEAAYRISNLFIAFYEFHHIFDQYEKFKKYNGLKDFTDMLVDLSENPSYIPLFKVVFLDEAQDLTPLQWKIAHFINENTDRMFIAGDDDQGIYRWAGADINHFIGLEGGSEVLSQSHRIPRSVFRVADSITRRIKKRQKKDWSPRPEEGSVSRTYDFWGIEFEEEEWLVLAQANYMLDEVARHLKSSGQFFERYGNLLTRSGTKTALTQPLW
jgi:DNA helicase-2/ATP-dependent DNA helicase PcrA